MLVDDLRRFSMQSSRLKYFHGGVVSFSSQNLAPNFWMTILSLGFDVKNFTEFVWIFPTQQVGQEMSCMCHEHKPMYFIHWLPLFMFFEACYNTF